MNLNAPQSAPASPAEAGTFSVGSATLRLLPTLGFLPFNFTPVGGFAVFAGARVRAWLAYALPLAVMLVTDLILWGLKGDLYSPLHVSRPMVYGSFLVYVFLGRLLAWAGILGLGAAALAGSVQFFLLTNFAAWIELSTLYPRTLEGLMESYAAGLPYFHHTVLSDLGFALAFLGLHTAWVKLSQPERSAEAIQS